MTRDILRNWAETEIKSRYKIEKIAPFKEAILALCRAAAEDGGAPGWIIKGVLSDVAAEYSYKE